MSEVGEVDSAIQSPPKKSSHKVHRGKGQHRRLSHGITSASALRDTLQAFGDDVIKIKDPPNLIPQMGLDEFNSGSINPSFISSEFEMLSGGGRHRDAMRFERIPSDEVGVRSTRWKKAIVAGLISSKLSKRESSSLQRELELSASLGEDRRPPFWGVGSDLREKFTLLNLQLILHEIGCFLSGILLGCLIVKALNVVTSTNSITSVKNEWNFFRLYGSVQSLLLMLTSLGFLIRVNTLKSSSLLTMPLLMVSVIFLVSTEYLNKAWDLQKNECLNYFNLKPSSQAKVYLTQNCDAWRKNDNTTYAPSPVEYFTAICPVIVAFFLALYLFIFRNSFYLINQFVTKQRSHIQN